MSDRKRVNISLDPQTYEKLQQVKQAHGFSSACELIVSFVHILLDRVGGEQKKYDLPDDDGRYIDEMFEELGHVQRTPDGTVPVRHQTKRLQ